MTSYNLRSPAVKRLMREAQELSQPTELYYAQPIEDNLFEWHFTIRGPEGSEFEGGIYHGQISLPTEYPMKPPNIMLLTPNGRFEQYRQICLSISGHHPETWCPSWSIRTALLAIIGFMPTSGAGAIGSMSVPVEERKKLAISSQNYLCDVCGPTKGLLLPLTSASSSTAQEAKKVASQFVLTDSHPSKECTPLESQASQFPEESTSNAPKHQMISQSTPSHLVATQANKSIRPVYWLCYPVYSVNRTEAGMDLTASASGPTKREPPLSFDKWLKTVYEHSASSDISRSQSTHSAPQCPESSPSFSVLDEVPGCILTAPVVAGGRSSCLGTPSAKVLCPGLLDEVPGIVIAHQVEDVDEIFMFSNDNMVSLGFVDGIDEVPGVVPSYLKLVQKTSRLFLTAQIPSAAKNFANIEEIPGVSINFIESIVEPSKKLQQMSTEPSPLGSDILRSSGSLPANDTARSRELSNALIERKASQTVDDMPEAVSSSRGVERVDLKVRMTKTDPSDKEVSTKKPVLNVCTCPLSNQTTDPEVPNSFGSKHLRNAHDSPKPTSDGSTTKCPITSGHRRSPNHDMVTNLGPEENDQSEAKYCISQFKNTIPGMIDKVPGVALCSRDGIENNYLLPCRDDCSQASSSASHRQGSSSSPMTIVLDAEGSDLHGEMAPSASLRCEGPMPPESTHELPYEPIPQWASASVTEDPQVVPLPSRDTCKERARQILENAAERHRQQAHNMMARFEGTGSPGRSVFERLRLGSHRCVWWAVLAVASVLIALILRRILIMSTTGPC